MAGRGSKGIVMKGYERSLEQWAKVWKDEHLTEEVRRLITLAKYDLNFGPVGDGAFGDPAADPDSDWAGYLGFSRSCELIAQALEDLPSQLYVNNEYEDWSETEPDFTEECCECDGTGEYASDDEDVETSVECDNCNGEGEVDLPQDEWYLIERQDLRKAIVGKSLEEYL
jgi:hypothetical protein